MPDELRQHLRYPEDLFRVQTDVYSKYQLPPERFFEREGAWSVAQAPSIDPRESTAEDTPATAPSDEQPPSELASESSANRFIPYLHDVRRDRRARAPSSCCSARSCRSRRADERTELQAYMTASSDPDTYGQLTAYVVQERTPGPRAVSNSIDSEPTITQQIALQTGGGNRVRFGDLQLVRVSEGLLWVRPFYAAVPQGSDRNTTVTSYRFVIVSDGSRAASGESLGEAIGKLFPGFEADLGDRVGRTDGSPTTGGDDTPPPETSEGVSDDPAELLLQADQLLAEADAALDTATSASTRRRSRRPRCSSTRPSS